MAINITEQFIASHSIYVTDGKKWWLFLVPHSEDIERQTAAYKSELTEDGNDGT